MKKNLSKQKDATTTRVTKSTKPIVDRFILGLLIILALLTLASLPDIFSWFGVSYPPAFVYSVLSSGCNSLSINVGYAMRLLIAGGFLVVAVGLAGIVYLIDKPDKGIVSKPHLVLILVAVISVICAIAIKPNCG